MSDEKIKKLNPLQYQVTQMCATERAFDNEYWDHHETGIYVDIVDGTPLFASIHKFDSGSGWPSFFQAISISEILETVDRAHGMVRTEVKSAKAKSHLGHVFPDGPKETGLRYCINSASLRFVAYEDLEKEGYGNLKSIFQKE